MKTNILILIALVGLGYGIMFIANDNLMPRESLTNLQDRGEVGEKVPEFSFQTFDRSYFNISDVKGDKMILLNFWASWCAPCKKEFPDLIRVARKHDDVILIALSSDLEENVAYAFFERLKQENHLPRRIKDIYVGLDPDQNITSQLFQTYKLPETLVIDKKLRIRGKLIGANWTREELENLIQKYR